MFWGAALMANVAEGEQLAQCKKVSTATFTKHLHMFGNIRGLLNFLEYNGWKPKHLEKMISQKRL